MSEHHLHRRDFLRGGLAAASAIALPGTALAETVLRDPGVRLPTPGAGRAAYRPVRVRGRVSDGRRGIPRVAVSDGLSVARTDPEGRFELVTDRTARWLHVSVPSGYALPTTERGTSRIHRAITPDSRGEMATEFRLAPSRERDRHAFLVLADPQTQNAFEMRRFRTETIPDIQATIDELGRPVFGVGCGDIMFDDLTMFPQYEEAVSRTGAPFFQVVGNHDLDFEGRTDEASTATFERHFGPGHYSFDRGEVHYVVLDDVFWHGAGYLGYLSDRQLTWLAADLEGIEPGRTVVVFGHIPAHSTRGLRAGESRPRLTGSIANRDALYRLLEPFRAHFLSGHVHELEHVFEGGIHECVNGAVCGAWWSGDICHDGTPNGYGVYEVNGSDVTWRYKSTGRPADHQMRLYRDGDTVIANVWNWDPEWTVVWHENGERKGAMERYTGLDPLSVELHAGEQRPERREWVEPVATDHLFRAEGTGTGAVTVEATDRFGRTYRSEI